jgi:hypothetical protein
MSSLDSFLEFEKRREKLRSPLLDEAENAFDDPGINFKGDSGITKQMEMDQKNDDALLLEVINHARTLAPDKAVQIRKLSKATGLPEEMVEEDTDGVERAVEAQKTKELLDNSPKLKEMAPDLSRFGHDDFDNLSVFERLHRDASAGLDTGMANREIGLARRKLMGEAFGEVFGEELTEPQKQELRNRIKELQAQLQQPSGGSGGFVEAAANALGSFIEGVPQVLAAGAIGAGSAAGISAVTGPAAPGVILGNAAIFAGLELWRQSSGVEGGHVAQELIDAGVEKDIANNVGEVSGNLAGLLEVAGANIIAAPFKDIIKNKFKENVKRTILKQTAKKSALVAGAKTFGKTMAGETATEVGQELISIAGVETGKSLSDKEFQSITATEIQHQVGEIFKETLKAMTILAIPGASISIYNQKKSADQALANQEYLRSMGENVQASKLKQRDGETHKEFSKRVHEGTSVDSVYIEAEKLQEVFQDDTGLLVEEIGAADQFEDAMARGGDIVIPLSVYTDKIAGDIDAHNKIMPHAKFDAEGLTAFRAEEMVKDEAEFRQKADRILKEQAGNTEFISSAEEVFQGVREQLVATGRFNDETVDNYAALHQAFSVVKAKQLGKTPAEVYEMFGLKVQKGEQVSDQQTLDQQAIAVKRTPEFQSFFEGSQIVDEAGEPLVVYHSTMAPKIESFKVDAEQEFGAHFGTSEQANNRIFEKKEQQTFLGLGIGATKPKGENVIPVFLNIKNPLRMRDVGNFSNFAKVLNGLMESDLSDAQVDEVLALVDEAPSGANEMQIIKDFVRGEGFDGVIYDNETEGYGDSYIAFDQNQIKSIFNERPTDSPDTLNQEVRSRGLYSAVKQAFQDMKIPAWKKENGEANGKDVWAKLKTMPGIKQEEIKWLTVEEFLTGNPKAKFTRQEVISFAEQNGVTVETVVADQEQDENFDGIQWTEQRVWDEPEAWQIEIEDAEDNGMKEEAIEAVRKKSGHNIPKEIEGLDAKNEWIEENYESEIDDQIEMIAQTRYMEDPIYIVESDEGVDLSLFGNDNLGWSVRRGGWQQHENTVIREPAYSLGEAKIQAEDYARENDLIRYEDEIDDSVKWSEYVMPGYMENYRELKLTLPDISGEFYEEAHFPDPNIVAFLRVNDRELSLRDSDQKLNTYFIDEFQSDWHQQGRQRGYSTGEEDAGLLEAEGNKKQAALFEDIIDEVPRVFEGKDALEMGAGNGNASFDAVLTELLANNNQIPDEMAGRQDGRVTPYINMQKVIAKSGRKDEFLERFKEQAQLYKKSQAERYGVPDAPFKGDSWMALGLKQAILDAVDNGYEAIAWADSEVLSNRWSERYEKLYRMQYDKKMPAIVKRLTGIESNKVKVDESLTISPSYHIIPITPELKQKVRSEGFTLFQSQPEQARVTPNWYYSQLAESFNALPDTKTQPQSAKGWKQLIKKLGIKNQELEWTGIFEWLDTRTKEQQVATLTMEVASAQAKLDGESARFDRDFIEHGDRRPALGMLHQMRENYDAAVDALAQAKAGKGPKITKSEISNWLFNNGVKVETVEIDNVGRVTEEEYDERQGDLYERFLNEAIEARLSTLTNDEIFRLATRDENGNLIKDEDFEVTRARIEADRDEIARQVEFEGNSEFLARSHDQAEEELGERSNHDEIGADLTPYTFKGGTDESSLLLKIEQKHPKADMATFHPSFQSHVFQEHGNIVTWIRKQTREENGKKILFIDEIQSDFESAVRSQNTTAQAPFTDSQSAYVGLAMKKVITYAVENDFDRVEWTTGSQQSERYPSLKDIAQRVRWNPKTEELSIVKKGTSTQAADSESRFTSVGKVEKNKLQATLGKDETKNLLERPLTNGVYDMPTGGVDVELSNKGMVDFYDRLVPDIAAKMIKSITGEKPVIEYEDPAPDSYDPGRQPGFDLDGVKAAFEGSRPSLALFQEKRGSFQFAEDITKDDSVINLFEAADLSTFLHESGHFFFEATRHLSNQPDSPQQIKDDMNTLLSFVGVDDIDKWNKMSLEERREGHERVARAFEAYLFEGRAPSANLANMFRRFRSWLVALYKNLSQLNVSLSDDVRSVFDRMLATDEEIRLAKESEDFRPLWDSRETAGMGQEEWANYQRQISQEEEEADELLQTRALRDMRYMEGARGKVLSDLQRVQRERRTGVKKAVSIEVANQPVYKAKQFLRTPIAKRPVVKSDPKVVDPTRDSLFTAIAKLGGIDRAEAVAMWGIDPTDKFASGIGASKPVVRKTKGVDLDMMAEKLAELDYLPTDEHGKWDLLDLEERFMDEHLGNKRFSAKNDEFDVSEAYENFLAEEEGFVYIDKESGGKLALQPLIEEYGNGEDALWRQLPLKGRYAMVTDEDHGFAPDKVAEEFGFGAGGGDKMIQALVAAPDMRVAVEEETDARMLELYGDLNTPTARSRAITEALHGDLRARVLHTEMKVLAKKMGSGNVVASTAKRYAEDKIARMKIIDIRPNDYLAAERRANRNAEKAIGEGRIDLAADHKRAAVLNHHFAKEATKALGDVDRALRYFNRLDGKASRERLHSDYTYQIDRLLSRYDLRKSVANKDLERRQTLNAWVNSEIEKGNSPVIDQDLLDETRLIHYRTIPVEELRGLRDAVTNIEHLGKLKEELLNKQAQRRVDDAASAISRSINKHVKQSSSRKSKTLSARLPQDMKGRLIDGFYAEHRKLAHLGFEMDGFEDAGPFWESVIRPMNERADWESGKIAEANKRLGSLFDAYSATEFSGNIVPLVGEGDLNDAVGDVLLPAKRLYKRRFFANVPNVREQGMGISLSRMEQIMIGLNWGNADNKRRVMDGYGWEEGHVDIVLDGLDARDWKFIQGVWDYFEEFWPEIEAKEKRVSGVAPDKVEALPVITKFGQFRGGYFPISFDADLSQEAFGQQQAQLAKDMMRGGFTRSTTAKGHTEARKKGKVSQPIRSDFGVIFQHVNQVIHDLAWHEFLVDTNKIVNHEEVKTAITARMGEDTFKVVGYTLQDIAAGDIQGGKAYEKAFNYIRGGVSISAMGWNLGTALLQPFGLTQGMARIGTKWVFKGMLKSMGKGAEGMSAAIQEMLDSSSFMRLRSQNINREIREIQSKIGGAGLVRQLDRALFKKLPKNFEVESITGTYFWLIAKAQMVADAPIWMGAREKALAEGRDPATAIELANQAVIDTQGSGHIKDLAGVMRGGPLLKLFTNFLSYFQSTFNLTMDKFAEAGVRDANLFRFAGKVIGKSFTDPRAMGLLAVDMLLLYTVPIVLAWYVREAVIQGECDHGADTACVFDKLAREHVGYALSGMIGLREMNGMVQGFTGYKGPAGTRFFSEATTLGVKAGGDVKNFFETGDLEISEGTLKAMNRTGGVLFHYPSVQMERLVTGYLDLQAGKTDIPTAPLFGYSKQ